MHPYSALAICRDPGLTTGAAIDVPEHFADRLLELIQARNAPACVGLDPILEKLPAGLLSVYGLSEPSASGVPPCVESAAAAIEAFGRGVIDAVAAHVPAIKINIAFFEPYHDVGIAVYRRLIQTAHDAGLIVIGDIKRGDIGHSSSEYARAHLGLPIQPVDATLPDAVTVNPYFGVEGVRPFIESAAATGRGLFVLVQTSNPSAVEVQGVMAADGRPIVEHVASLVQRWAVEPGLQGRSGYSCVGAVVSPRDLESTRRIRGLMPNCLFLVPGLGAQGRTADEAATCFRTDGTGALVTASRSVIYAHAERGPAGTGGDWKASIEQACGEFVAQIRRVLRRR